MRHPFRGNFYGKINFWRIVRGNAPEIDEGCKSEDDNEQYAHDPSGDFEESFHFDLCLILKK